MVPTHSYPGTDTGHGIIDLTGRLTETNLVLQGASLTASFDTKVLQHLELAASTAALDLLTDTGHRIGFFGVTPDGTIDYDPAYDRAFSGRSSSTLPIITF